ncbi:hypothetical protein D3C76_1148820 [compost metagenome]
MVETSTPEVVVFSSVPGSAYGPPDSVGASLTATTVTVLAIASTWVSTPPLLVPPVSRMLVRVTTRLVVSGAWLLLR